MNPELPHSHSLETSRPFFSICVPQYNRTSFLIAACQVLLQQTCHDFELCISDDCSTDGRSEELRHFLEASGLRFVYEQSERNLRYDANLRRAISLASGHYCVLMGNDDCFADAKFLERLCEVLLANPNVGVLMTNYVDYYGGRIFRRVRHTLLVGSGPGVATSRFRNFSFVSGVILLRDRAQAHQTAAWDGSEMYQMYLACRIISEGYDLFELDEPAIRMGIRLPGESVDSYASRPKLKSCPVVERCIPLGQMGRLVYDAVSPFSRHQQSGLALKVFLQIILFTYPFWIVEYRRVQSWRFAAGICLGMRPRNLFGRLYLPIQYTVFLRTVYFIVSCAGLLTPISLFEAYQPKFHDLAKALFQRT